MNNAFAERPLKPLEYVTILEQDTRFELALSVWKTDVLATDTNPAWLPKVTNHSTHHPNLMAGRRIIPRSVFPVVRQIKNFFIVLSDFHYKIKLPILSWLETTLSWRTADNTLCCYMLLILTVISAAAGANRCLWCGLKDLNLHKIAPISSSS